MAKISLAFALYSPYNPRPVMANNNSLVEYINRKNWWHVPPFNEESYGKRGIFYSPTFRAAEFWGRPLDEPQRVSISRPLVGDEQAIQRELFGKCFTPPADDEKYMTWRFALDARMRNSALRKGYDAIVVLSPSGATKYRSSGKIPRSIELNILRYPA